MKCPFCGTHNQSGEAFCTNCGAYLDPSANSPTTVSTMHSSTVTGNTLTATTTGDIGNSRTLTPNTKLENGRYVVDKILGQGGMGAAVLARDTRVSNKQVVIKELISDNSDPTQRQEDVRNFEREVEMLAQLDHPLIPSVTDSFRQGSRYFMVQEYVPGEDLEKHMERTKQPMPEREALTYTSQVLDMLDYLSQQTPPIVHRDIKPANIIIGNRDKRAHLEDFGIARADVAKNSKRKQTAALGTPGYAPPEQYQGNADARSDLYALAATLHHLITNRDPRDYPPFLYPPARTINPQLSADIEHVLEKALKMQAAERYQSAAAMKHDIDAILGQRFNMPADSSSYTFSTSGSMSGAVHVTPLPPAAPPVQQQVSLPPSYSLPMPPPQQAPRNNLLRNFALLLIVIAIIGILLFTVIGGQKGISGIFSPGDTATGPDGFTPNNGIGISMIGGEPIGLSDGRYVFDASRGDGQQKQQAAQKLLDGDTAGAQSLWRDAVGQESNDAEALIYLENQRVLASGKPYVTMVVGLMLSGPRDLVTVGRDTLQGVYVAQKEYNSGTNATHQLRVLIANAGSKTENTRIVGKQIVQAAKQDPTIVGVMGWPYSSYAQTALEIFSNAKIPLVSQTASSDALTGASSYFFRVAPPDKSQSGVAAQYASQTLHAKNVVVFKDSANSYSQSLADGFRGQFTGTIIDASYSVGNKQSVADALKQVLNGGTQPDLIYFAGYSADVSVILEQLPATSNLQVLGGDAFYELGGYSKEAHAGFNRLRFTAFAYPDEWDILGYGNKKPTFYADYAKYYDPYNKHKGTYGFTRADQQVILSYDAMVALTTAANNALAGGKASITPEDVRLALTKISGAQAIQGASGQIAFGSEGDPVGKAVLILRVNPAGYIQMESQLGGGQLLKG